MINQAICIMHGSFWVRICCFAGLLALLICESSASGQEQDPQILGPGSANRQAEFKIPFNQSLGVDDAGASPWSLPISGPLDTGTLQATPMLKISQRQSRVLDAAVSYSNVNTAIGRRVEELFDSALAKDPKTKQIERAVSHYRKRSQVLVAETKDAANYLVPFRGFGPSIEAGQLILSDKVSLKTKASAEYAKQRQIDETHFKVVSAMMQIAQGIGTEDQVKGYQISSSGLKSLAELVGDEEAKKTMSVLAAWKADLVVPESVYQSGAWDNESRMEKRKRILQVTLESDSLINDIKQRLSKYANKSKFSRVSGQVVQTSLGVAALTPSFVGPAAKLALLGYVMATGGPEQNKLMKELYLDKRLESRWRVLNEETHMALENYQIGVLTRNPVLIGLSESVIEQMTDAPTISDLFGVRVNSGGI